MLAGTGSVTVGGVTRPVKKGDVWVIPANTPHGGQFEDAPQVLFISSPIDDPDNQDRVWLGLEALAPEPRPVSEHEDHERRRAEAQPEQDRSSRSTSGSSPGS